MQNSIDRSIKLRASIGGLVIAIGLLAGTSQLIAHTPVEPGITNTGSRHDHAMSIRRMMFNEPRPSLPKQAAADQDVCVEPAAIYVEAVGGVFAADVWFEVESNLGIEQFAIAAGTNVITAADIVLANRQQMLVTASVSGLNPNRVEIGTMVAGDLWFVSVKQILAGAPVLYKEPVGGVAMSELTDYGCDAGQPCFEFATAFIEVGPNLVNAGDGAIGFEMFSDQGAAAYAFLSGSSTMSIVNAINSFADEVGVVAKLYSPTGGIVLRSAFASSGSYLSVHQINGSVPMLQIEPGVGETAFEVYDEGLDQYPGDTNHNDVIDTDDLTNVINDWGNCSDSQPCDGDLNGDNNVDVDDLLAVVNNWGIGECPVE